MIKQGFHIGEHDWYVMCYYDIRTEDNLTEVGEVLLSAGCNDEIVCDAIDNLRNFNSGFSFSNKIDKISLIFVSKTTSAEQAYDTIQHELKHVVEHICDAFGVGHDKEEAAYLQGEIARKMFRAVSILFCPHCNS